MSGPVRAYAKRKADGQPGWMSPEEYQRFQAAVEMSFAQARFPARGRLLELGCGAGNMSVWLAGKGYEVYGVDHSPTALVWAGEHNQEAGTHVRFSVGDVTNLGEFADGFFDIVFDARCFHWLAGADRARAFAAARRVLRVGGYFLMSSQCGEFKTDKWKADGLTFDPEHRVVLNRHGLVAAYVGMPDSLMAEVVGAGFRIVHHVILTEEGSEDVIHVAAVKAGAM